MEVLIYAFKIKEPLVFLYGLPVSDKEGRKELFWRLYSLIEDVLLSLDRHDVYLIAKEHGEYI